MHHTTDYHAIAEFTAGQNGNITPSQARAIGLSDFQIRQRVTTGALSRSGKHVLRGTLSEPTPLSELNALVLDCGPEAVASGATALALFELDGTELVPPFHVTLLRGRVIVRPPHHVHTTLVLPSEHLTRRRGIPTMTLPAHSPTRRSTCRARSSRGPTTVRFATARRPRTWSTLPRCGAADGSASRS